MARLTWDASGERFYETGVDRGVLYVDDIGVPWNGLISVSETSNGGEARPYYIDGVKYLNLATAEEFQATLTALSSPPEFGICDGVASLQNGLFATQQPRRSFGLSYRTMVGNDLETKARGYKIHLVYNALSGPAERSYSTLGEDTQPTIFSWPITTLPPSLTGRKPTAHFVVDTRYTPVDILAEVEDLLYGNDSFPPSLPTVDALVAIFQS